MKELMDLLFAQIEHGDAEHKQWLRDKLDNFAKVISSTNSWVIYKFEDSLDENDEEY